MIDNIMMYSIWDKKDNKFDTPFFAHSDLFAERHFRMMAQKSNVISSFLIDFTLFKLGIFNITSGVFVPEFDEIISGIQIIKEDRPNEISNGA